MAIADLEVRFAPGGLDVEAPPGRYTVLGEWVDRGEIELTSNGCRILAPPVSRTWEVRGAVRCGGSCPPDLRIVGVDGVHECATVDGLQADGSFVLHVAGPCPIQACLPTDCGEEVVAEAGRGTIPLLVPLPAPRAGIGLVLDGLAVSGVSPDSALAGRVQPGSRLLAIDGIGVVDERDAVARLNGKPGSVVRILFDHAGVATEFTVTRRPMETFSWTEESASGGVVIHPVDPLVTPPAPSGVRSAAECAEAAGVLGSLQEVIRTTPDLALQVSAELLRTELAASCGAKPSGPESPGR